MNDLGRVSLKAPQPLVVDSYACNRATGSFILIDEATHNTVAAGMIV
jgi:bifunctional enzyme CysN/CysC